MNGLAFGMPPRGIPGWLMGYEMILRRDDVEVEL
jgi:hypothetical protein